MSAPAAADAWRSAPVGVVGLGLIGGSIALDLRQQGVLVHGVAHRPSSAERALERGLVDRVSTDFAVLEGCGLVVLALPLDQLLAPDPALVAALPPAAVITDVGSVKAPVLAVWRPLHRRFVASHPMAGTAQAGVEAGLNGLFAGRPWVLTPAVDSEPAALATVAELADALGARCLRCDAASHDQAVALISHLPVLVSAALIQAADRGAAVGNAPPELAGLVRALASSGFADTTRVGGGNPQLGVLMARSNQPALAAALQQYSQCLAGLSEQVQRGLWPELEEQLRASQRLRADFVEQPPVP
jgi:arogenate dehydrogenase (NADP+)